MIDLESFAKKKGIELHETAAGYNLKSPKGRWFAFMASNGKWTLRHENLFSHAGHMGNSYHPQRKGFSSMYDIIKYIAAHDRVRFVSDRKVMTYE